MRVCSLPQLLMNDVVMLTSDVRCPPLSLQDVTVGFTQDAYDVPEGIGFLNVTVEVVGTLGRAVTVSLTTQDGTAVCKCNLLCVYIRA